MKKWIVLVALVAVSGCSCLQSREPAVEETKVVYRTYQPAPRTDCDAFENGVCYRYASTPKPAPAPIIVPAPAPVPAPVRYTRPQPIQYTNNNYVEPTPVAAPTPVYNENPGDCAPKYRSTREPVEVVYKKVTYKTVYEPKTSSSVSYEKEPYNGQVEVPSRPVRNVRPQPIPMEETEIMTLDEIK